MSTKTYLRKYHPASAPLYVPLRKAFAGLTSIFAVSSSTTVFQDRRAHTPGVSVLENLTSRPQDAQNRLDRPKIHSQPRQATEKQQPGNRKATLRQRKGNT